MKGENTILKTTAHVLNVQRFCLHDGPGIRTVVFFKGCPLRCQWCSNPESQSFERELMYHRRLCISCRKCEDVCANKTLRCMPEDVSIDRQACDACGACVATCPAGALELAGTTKTITEIIEEIQKDRAYYDNSGGGITLSGGEPLAQPEAVSALLNACKQQGFHTAVETCGHVNPEVFDAVYPLTDLFLFDIKAIDAQHHLDGTGHDNRRILLNLRNLCDLGANLIVRVPLIPEYNLNDTFRRELIDFLSTLPTKKVELIPYHRLGSSKYEALGRKSAFANLTFASTETLEHFKTSVQ